MQLLFVYLFCFTLPERLFFEWKTQQKNIHDVIINNMQTYRCGRIRCESHAASYNDVIFQSFFAFVNMC